MSSGMMKKLEPVLHFQRRTMHCRPSIATIKPLNAAQDNVQSLSKKGKEQDVYCFPSSPKGSNTEETSASKGEREKEKRAERKAKKVTSSLNIVAYWKGRGKKVVKIKAHKLLISCFSGSF